MELIGVSIRRTVRKTQNTLLNRYFIRLLATSILFCAIGNAAYAQTLPTEIPSLNLPQSPQIRDVPQSPELLAPLQPEAAPPTNLPVDLSPSNELPPVADKIFVSEFRFLGNSVFSSRQLLEISSSYLNREITFSDLLELQSKITEFYVKNGYITSRAYISAKENQNFNPKGASITITVTEGQVEELRVEGAPRLEKYVHDRIQRAISPAFNEPKLEDAIRLLRIDPLIKSISVDLSGGANGTSDVLRVVVEQNPPFHLAIAADNSRSALAGSFEQGIEVDASNLLSLGESGSIGYSRTEGSNQYKLGFSVPLNAQNGKLSFESIDFNSRIVQKPFNAFDIASQNRSYRLAYRQPIKRTATNSQAEELALGLSVARLESSSTIEGFPFPLSPGANADGQTRITELAFFQDYQKLTRRSVTAVHSEIGAGLNIFGWNSTGGDLDSEYLVWRGQAGLLKKVGKSRLLVQSNAQLTGNELVPLAQFSLGNLRSAQSFRQLSLLSDNGFTSSVEFQTPVTKNSLLSVVPFLDAGLGWNNGSGRTIKNDLLIAPGVGLQIDIGHFSARANYAVPLANLEEGSESRLGFQLQYQMSF